MNEEQKKTALEIIALMLVGSIVVGVVSLILVIWGVDNSWRMFFTSVVIFIASAIVFAAVKEGEL